MKNINSIYTECVQELNNIGIYPPEIDYLKINSRAKSRWGKASYNRRTKEYTIEIAQCLMEDIAPIKATKNTMIHELLHTCNAWEHTSEWKRLANKVNQYYDYNISRADSYRDKGFMEDPLKTESKPKYQITCNGCRYSWYYQRNVSMVNSCRHGKAKCACGSKEFTVITLR